MPQTGGCSSLPTSHFEKKAFLKSSSPMLRLRQPLIFIALLATLVSSPPVLAWSPRPKATGALPPSTGNTIDGAKSAIEIEGVLRVRWLMLSLC